MRRLAFIFMIFFLAGISLPAQENVIPQDAYKALDDHLEEYFKTLEAEPLDVKIEECDFILEHTSDSLLKQHAAIKIYDHYLNSPVMGDEAIPIHLTDKWFAPGKVHFQTETELVNAQVYADFNRQSLLGCQAQPLRLFTMDSTAFDVKFDRLTVLYFYDTDCPKCRAESILLKPLLEKENYPVNFYAVYTGVNKESWQKWIREKLTLNAPNTKIVNLWDPEVDSDYQMKYGILSTPKMFLINSSGKIVGRGMDCSALEQLLDIYLKMEDYEYGGEETRALMDELFKDYGDTLKASDILDVAELLKSSTLDKGDTLFYKHLEGDLLYYLSNHKGEEYSKGSLDFVNEYILSRPDIWRTSDDTLKVVGLAEMMQGLLSRTPVGSTLPKDIPIPGWNRFRRKGGYLIFHESGCSVCAAELSALDSLQRNIPKRKRSKVLEVETDKLFDEHPAAMNFILDTFDLSSLPYIMKIGPGGEVQRKYVTFLK